MLFDLFLVIKRISYVNNHAKGYKKFHRFYSCYKALNHLLNKIKCCCKQISHLVCVPAEKCFAGLAGDSVEVVAQRLVPTDQTCFVLFLEGHGCPR